MTINEAIAKEPWMENFREDMREKCPDCDVEIGQEHIPGCDLAECPLCHWQDISCGCPAEAKGGTMDVWLGLGHRTLHKIALEEDLWCHDLDEKGVPCHPRTAFEKAFYQKLEVTYHHPCKRDDPFASADLNRAGCVLRGLRARRKSKA